MNLGRLFGCAAVLALASGCVTTRAAHDRRAAAAQDAVAALQAARFEDAEAQSAKLIAADPENATARGVAAIALYRRTLHEFVTHVIGFAGSAAATAMLRGGFIDTGYLEFTTDEAEAGLAQVAAHLDAAAKDPYFSLELCLACWEVDWNRNGQVDERDRRLLEVEVDADLRPLPDGDPRRKPTFHFDLADVHWLRALVSFQRALGQVVRAYDFSELGKLVQRGPRNVTVRLKDKAKIAAARAHLLAGLDAAEKTRALVLAEDDDDREWLPNPRQKNHPLPFPVDDALFETWAGVLSDVRGLVEGKTGVSVEELARLGKNKWEKDTPPQGFIDVAQLLNHPADIELKERHVSAVEDGDVGRALEAELKDFFGSAWKPQMTATPLFGRLKRMKGELDRGEDSFARKLRYLFWLN